MGQSVAVIFPFWDGDAVPRLRQRLRLSVARLRLLNPRGLVNVLFVGARNLVAHQTCLTRFLEKPALREAEGLEIKVMDM